MKTFISAALVLAACGGTTNPTTDLATPDLGAQAGDLATADLATPDLRPAADLATPDLAPPKLSGVPANCPAGVTAQALYTNVVQKSCALKTCHAGGGIHFSITSAADLRTAWVNKNADQPSTGFPYVTPGNLDRSYVVYKLLGQQDRVSDSGGAIMPAAGRLSDSDICQFVSWIQAGAN